MSEQQTETPSLRLRVLVIVVVLFALLSTVVGVFVDVALGRQLVRDLDARLTDRADRSVTLVEEGTNPEDLVQALAGDAIRVRVVTSNGTVYGMPPPGQSMVDAPPAGPGAAGPPIQPGDGAGPPVPPALPSGSLEVSRPLPDGSTVTLLGDTSAIDDVRRQLRVLMVAGGVATTLLASLVLTFAVGRALSPLDSMTDVARRITNGDRGRRLRPTRPSSELGRTAVALDEMLDAVEEAENRQRVAADSARRAEEALRTFLADAAHELRTPIAGMSALAQSLARDGVDHPERIGRWSELLSVEAAQAERLVEDMLDSVRSDHAAALVIEPVDIRRLVQAGVERGRILSPETVFTVDADRIVGHVDAGRIGQVVANVLDNARRAVQGGGRVDVTVTQDDVDVFVTIDDTGPGVPTSDRERIFERLVRLNPGRDRSSGGAGLGLSIARTLARAHGGNLTCESGAVGARFVLRFPIQATVNA